MTRIVSDDYRGIKQFFINGYSPDYNFLKSLDWKRYKKNIRSLENISEADFYYFYHTLPRHFMENAEEPNEKLMLKLYDRLIAITRWNFCIKNTRDKFREGDLCKFTTWRFQGYKDPKKYLERYYSTRELKKFTSLEPFIKEFERDERMNRKRNILFHKIFNSYLYKVCNHIDECDQNWMGLLGFELKNRNSYENFEEFGKACRDYHIFEANMMMKEME